MEQQLVIRERAAEVIVQRLARQARESEVRYSKCINCVQ